jgi:hypothetical protein
MRGGTLKGAIIGVRHFQGASGRSDRRKGNGGRVPHRLRAARLAQEAAERQRALNAPIPTENAPEPIKGELRRFVEARLGRELE